MNPGMMTGDNQQGMTPEEMIEAHAYAQQYAAAIELQQRHYAALNDISGASTVAAANDYMEDRRLPALTHDPYKRYTGILANFKDDRGFGWLKCPEAFKTYGKDVFIHRGDIFKDL